MSVFFAAVFVAEEGGYHATFPDLPGCITQADSLEELDPMLRDALCVYLEGLADLGQVAPSPRSHGEVLAEVEAEDDFHGLVLVAAPSRIERTRINMRVPVLDLEIIDRAATARNMDRSAFMVMAAKREALDQA